MSSETPEPFSSLPEQPLDTGTITELQKHDGIETCLPVYHLAGDPDSIVGILASTESQSRLLFYDPDEDVWVSVFKGDVLDDGYSREAVTLRESLTDGAATIQDMYDDDEVVFIRPRDSDAFEPVDDVFTELLSVLPNHPVRESVLERVADEPDFGPALPHIFLEPAHEVVVFTITYQPYDEDEPVQFGLAYFDEESETWEHAFSMPLQQLEQAEESTDSPAAGVVPGTEFDAAVNDVYDIVTEQYPIEQLSGVSADSHYFS